MAIVAQRASFLTHLRAVLWTPFAVVAGSLYVHKWKVLIIVAAGVIAWLAGQLRIHPPAPNDLNVGLIAILSTILVLLALGAAMTSFDHFRFGGWTDDADVISTTAAHAFLHALIRNDQKEAARFLPANFNRGGGDFGARFDQWRQQLGDAATIVTSEQLNTVDHMVFRAALPSLTRLTIDPDHVVLLVPMISSLDQRPGTPMKIGQCVMRRDCHDRIVEFDVITIPRPEILR